MDQLLIQTATAREMAGQSKVCQKNLLGGVASSLNAAQRLCY